MYKIHYVLRMCIENFHKVLKINDLRAFLRPFQGGRLSQIVPGGAFWAAICLAICACGGGDSREGRVDGEAMCSDSVQFAPQFYSNLFRRGSSCGQSLVEIRSEVGRDTLVKRFVLADSAFMADTARLRRLTAGREWQGATVVRVPVRRAVVLSSAQLGFMLRLGVEDRIVGVGAGAYIVDSALAARVTAGEILEVGNGPQVSLEKVVSLKPDLVMTFATGGAYDDYDRLATLGVPLMLTSEWQENNPFAKFEWISLFAKLFGALPQAAQVVKPYAQVIPEMAKKESDPLAACRENGPRVIAGMAYGGVWYAPGGRSYTASLIRQAGGCYLWASDTTRELKFSLEEIFAVADSADVWVNPGIYGTPEDILAAEPRLARLKPFRTKRVCQNDARKSAGGGNDFFESAVSRPVELVQNLHECIFGIKEGDSGNISEGHPYKWYRNIYNFAL